jgi:hypothetical protein
LGLANGTGDSRDKDSTNGGGQVIETAEAARKILSGVPQLSETDLVKEAIRIGWKASGSEKKDVRRFCAAMHRQEDVFEKVPGMSATWRLKK